MRLLPVLALFVVQPVFASVEIFNFDNSSTTPNSPYADLGGWSSQLNYNGLNVYPEDTSVSLICQDQFVESPFVKQSKFEGLTFGVIQLPPTECWVYSNGNTTDAPYDVVRIPVGEIKAGLHSVALAVSNSIDLEYEAGMNIRYDTNIQRTKNPLVSICINETCSTPVPVSLGENWKMAYAFFDFDQYQGNSTLRIVENQLDIYGADLAIASVRFSRPDEIEENGRELPTKKPTDEVEEVPSEVEVVPGPSTPVEYGGYVIKTNIAGGGAVGYWGMLGLFLLSLFRKK